MRLQDASRDWRCWGSLRDIHYYTAPSYLVWLERWDQRYTFRQTPAMTTIPYSKPRTKADVVRESFAHPANNTYYFSHLSNPTAYNSSLIYLMSQRQQGGGMGMGMAGMGMMNPMMVSQN